MSSDSLSPTLPPELEREIFQMLAYSDPLFAPKLMLVACRVKAWVETDLYRVLVLADFFDCFPFKNISHLKSIPAPLLRDSVRTVHLGGIPLETAEYILSTCTGIEDLLISTGMGNISSLLHLLGRLPLRRFVGDPRDLSDGPMDFSHPFFSQLTHLHPFALIAFSSAWRGLASVPHLTHFSFDEGFLHLVPHLLQHCKCLRAAVLRTFSEDTWIEKRYSRELETLATEVRFVQMAATTDAWWGDPLKVWDYCIQAEEHIAKRVSGKIDVKEYRIC
ncbi:hypothetical protein FB45DRAFT_1061682 [Roridomyces roridus]|uniref:Uncharacterized protein n=1 Tax=Roridomyces roridus TaxID=1738132 RepID=A0AAD7BIK4_9AGAR|nr:hypothetical protein FB45DRAFT_1061682 [Roridomyces roridus]